MLTCSELTRGASVYIDGPMSFGERMRFRMHLALCRHCRSFMRNFERTIELTRGARQPGVVPSEAFLARVSGAVAERLGGHVATANALSVVPAGARFQAPYLRLVTDSAAEPRVERIFREIESALGSVPNLFRAYANHPDVLEANWARVRAVMLQGSLSRKLKESIAVVVSNDNGCRYCVEQHSRRLLAMGVPREEVDRLLRDPLAGNFAPKERALLALARQANRDPHGGFDRQILVARQAGTTDAEIIEALAVMELYLSFNRFVDTLELPLETA